jgi:DNA-binding response OmpR family regulator
VSGTRVVVVEDDPSVAELVTLYLKNAGFVVEHCATAAEARAAFALGAPACVVLDLGLPDADGLELFAELRRMHDSPVVALTARAEDVQKVAGLDAGLDDYLTKPFNPRELVARVNAVIRRATGSGGTRPLEIGNLLLDPARHEVIVDGQAVALRAKEFELPAAGHRAHARQAPRERLGLRVPRRDADGRCPREAAPRQARRSEREDRDRVGRGIQARPARLS